MIDNPIRRVMLQRAEEVQTLKGEVYRLQLQLDQVLLHHAIDLISSNTRHYAGGVYSDLTRCLSTCQSDPTRNLSSWSKSISLVLKHPAHAWFS